MANILHPTREIQVGGETVKVRELNWREGLEFLQMLGEAVGQIANSKGEFEPTPENLRKLITSSSDLSSWLLTHATERDGNWLGEQRVADVIELLSAAIELNLSEELVSRGKGLADRVRAVFGPNTMPVPSGVSSGSS